MVNALWQDDYAELRIPNSENVPSVGEQAIIDTETNTYLPTDEIRRRFRQAGATDDAKVVTYCGGGIAASSTALAARAAGFEDVAVYDGSMEEWRADPDLPTASDD